MWVFAAHSRREEQAAAGVVGLPDAPEVEAVGERQQSRAVAVSSR